jgi:hypothetical protein
MMTQVIITIEDDGEEVTSLKVQGVPRPGSAGTITPSQALALTIQERFGVALPVYEYAGVDD